MHKISRCRHIPVIETVNAVALIIISEPIICFSIIYAAALFSFSENRSLYSCFVNKTLRQLLPVITEIFRPFVRTVLAAGGSQEKIQFIHHLLFKYKGLVIPPIKTISFTFSKK